MRRFLTFLLLLCAVLMNMYLIFYWKPVDNHYSEKKISEEVISHSKSIYKINKDEVLDKLTDTDKGELEKIIYKLSSFDIGKIKKYIQDDNEEMGIVNAFKVLKTRLSLKDYERIKDICSRFLDIDELEKKIIKK